MKKLVKRKLGKRSRKDNQKGEERKDTNYWGKPYKPRLVTENEMTNWNIHQPKSSNAQSQKPSFQMKSPFQQRQQPIRQQPQQQPQQYQEEEEEPYWSAEEWEEWAIDVYENYPEMHQYLPTWFLEAYQEQQ